MLTCDIQKLHFKKWLPLASVLNQTSQGTYQPIIVNKLESFSMLYVKNESFHPLTVVLRNENYGNGVLYSSELIVCVASFGVVALLDIGCAGINRPMEYHLEDHLGHCHICWEGLKGIKCWHAMFFPSHLWTLIEKTPMTDTFLKTCEVRSVWGKWLHPRPFMHPGV